MSHPRSSRRPRRPFRAPAWAAWATALALGAAGGGAQAAAVTVYTNLSAWSTAAGSPVLLEDFGDTTLQPGFAVANGSIGGGVFNASASTQFNDANNPRWTFGASKAFSAEFDLAPGGPGDGLLLVISFADGTTGQQFIGNPAGAAFSGFWGLVADEIITAVRFDAPFTGFEEFNADNVRFIGRGGGGGGGGGGTVPEPSSLLLASLAGLAMLGAQRRSPQRHVVSPGV